MSTLADSQTATTPTHARGEPSRDLALVRRVQARDAAALDEFAQRIACIRAFVRARNRRFGEPLEASALDDLAQDVAMTAWQKLDTYRGESPLEGWLFRLADLLFRNAARAALRRRPRSVEVTEELSGAVPSPDDAALRLERDHAVRTAIDCLPPADAALLLARIQDGRRFAELAAEEGVSETALKMRFYRALDRLRARLRESGMGGTTTDG